MCRTVFGIAVLLCAAVCLWAGDAPPSLKPLKVPVGHDVPNLKITAPATAAVGQKVFVILATSEMPVRWEVKGASWASEADNKNLLVGLPDAPGGANSAVIRIRCITVVKTNLFVPPFAPSDWAETTITVPAKPVNIFPDLPQQKLKLIPEKKKAAPSELKNIEEDKKP